MLITKVTSLSTGKLYDIFLDNGVYSCSCPDYIFRQAKILGQCKHIKEFLRE